MSTMLPGRPSDLTGSIVIKNDLEDPDVTCRLVGQEINLHADDTFYAATPPLEAKRLLFSEFSSQRTRNGKPLQLSFVDVKKA